MALTKVRSLGELKLLKICRAVECTVEMERVTSAHFSVFRITSSCLSETKDLRGSDMKLGRNVARTFLDYYRLNALVERPLAPIPKTRKEKLPLFKCTTQRGQGSSHVGRKPEKRSQTNLKEPSLST
nr:PREDICTED: cytosolic carboxypeptidase 6-like [Struthio camelus australis]